MYEVPCRKCTKRTIGCHAICKAYIDWSAGHKAEKAKIREVKDQLAYVRQAVSNMKRG